MCFLYGWIPLAYFKLRLRGVFESTYKQFWSKAIASLVPKNSQPAQPGRQCSSSCSARCLRSAGRAQYDSDVLGTLRSSSLGCRLLGAFGASRSSRFLALRPGVLGCPRRLLFSALRQFVLDCSRFLLAAASQLPLQTFSSSAPFASAPQGYVLDAGRQ